MLAQVAQTSSSIIIGFPHSHDTLLDHRFDDHNKVHVVQRWKCTDYLTPNNIPNDICFTSTNDTMASSLSRSEVLGKVYKMVPPMLEKFHKGENTTSLLSNNQ